VTPAEMIRLARRRTAAGGVTPLPLADAAKILDVQVRTLYRWVERGLLERQPAAPADSPRGRAVLVDLGAALRVRDGSLLHPPGSPLTYREIEMLRLAASGYTSQQIGERVGATETSVANSLTRTTTKLGARTRLHGVVIALYLNVLGFQDIDLPVEG
jgi:DNA-binding CsgD family transcriptional regulator